MNVVEVLKDHSRELFGAIEFIEEYDLMDELNESILSSHHFEVKDNKDRLVTIAFDILDVENTYAVWTLENSDEELYYWYFQHQIEIQDNKSNITSYI